MWYGNFREQTINLQLPEEKYRLLAFLERQGLALDGNVEYAVAVMDGEKMAASGALDGRVLKCIAVDEAYKNSGLSAKVVSHLISEAYEKQRTHLFVYTKPENKAIFSELGFYAIAEVPSKVVLMENRPDGIKRYIETLAKENGSKADSAAVVVNCNPFTLGHRYLIEYAASRCQRLHVFVLWEDRSSFPAEIRYRLVKEGTRHLSNVVLHQGKDYIISDATFPSYFIKTYQELVETHAKLDLEIFSRYIAPALGIRKRFVGEEPYCKVTAAYNAIMKALLPVHGIEVEVVPRKLADGEAISASRVRELIRSEKLQEVRTLVPETTYSFLLSEEAQEIIRQIRSGSRRH